MLSSSQRFLAKVKADILKATEVQGQRIVESIKSDVPVRTGTLRDATTHHVQDLGTRIRLEVENTCPYAAPVEYGHIARGQDHETHVPPHPFMRRSYYDEAANYVRRIKGGL